MSSNVNAIFYYEGNSVIIQCTNTEKMSTIFKRFADKINSDVNDYNFYYNNLKIEKDSTILKLNNNNISETAIIITVKNALKIIKCPDCDCNDSIMKIIDYKILFSGCKNNHNKEMIFSKYDMSQNVQLSNIICDNPKCEHNQQRYWGNFYKCLNCTDINEHSKYYCNDCKASHDKEHKLIKYNEKDFYCEESNHFLSFSYFCITCYKDLCEKCLSVHKGHNIKKYDSLIQNIDDIKQNLNVIESKIKKLRHIVEDIKVQLDRAMKIMEKYYSISKDIIEKFELYNKSLKNHRIIFSVLNIKESNENIMNDLNKIIYSEDLKNKCISLIDIYHEDRMIYTNSQLNISQENERGRNNNENSSNRNNKQKKFINDNKSKIRLNFNKK